MRWSTFSDRASNASHRPSGDSTRLASTRWVWSCGSIARLVCWRNAAATTPSASTTATSPSIRNRVWAWSSIQAATAATAASWAATTSGAHPVVAQRPQDRHGLRSRVRDVEAPHRRRRRTGDPDPARGGEGRGPPSRPGTPRRSPHRKGPAARRPARTTRLAAHRCSGRSVEHFESTNRAAMIYQHATEDRDRLIAERLGAMTVEAGLATVLPIRAHHDAARSGTARRSGTVMARTRSLPASTRSA